VEFEGKLTKVVVNDFSNLCFIVVTDVGKIGQLVGLMFVITRSVLLVQTQIDWPIDTLGQCRHSSAVYNSKLLLGVENVPVSKCCCCSLEYCFFTAGIGDCGAKVSGGGGSEEGAIEATADRHGLRKSVARADRSRVRRPAQSAVNL
jgi:hypothetical protein